MKYILIEFPEASPSLRLRLGNLYIYEDNAIVFGPAVVDGASDTTAAIAAGNPTRDPTKAFGDTPFGEYIGALKYHSDTPGSRYSYGLPDATGQIPVIHIQPIESDSQAWNRQLSEGIHVDMGLLLHAGALNGGGGLRPTHGCVRQRQENQTATVNAFKGVSSFKVTIQKIAAA